MARPISASSRKSRGVRYDHGCADRESLHYDDGVGLVLTEQCESVGALQQGRELSSLLGTVALEIDGLFNPKGRNKVS